MQNCSDLTLYSSYSDLLRYYKCNPISTGYTFYLPPVINYEDLYLIDQKEIVSVKSLQQLFKTIILILEVMDFIGIVQHYESIVFNNVIIQYIVSIRSIILSLFESSQISISLIECKHIVSDDEYDNVRISRACCVVIHKTFKSNIGYRIKI